MKRSHSVLGLVIVSVTAVVLVSAGTPLLRGQTKETRRAALRLSLPNEEFTEGEPIYLQVERKEGPEVRLDDLLCVGLKDEKGNIKTYAIGRGGELVSLFGERVPAGGGPGWRLVPGRYQVWVLGADEYSDTLSFEVRAATGDNAEALRLLELGLRARFIHPESTKLGIKQGQDREFWRKIVGQYPTSVCAPVALGLLIDGRWVGPRIWTPVEEVIADCKRMLEDYSDFWRAHWYVWVIGGLYREIGKVEEGKAYLRSLIDEHPNPKIVEAANAVLDKWKKDQPKQDNE